MSNPNSWQPAENFVRNGVRGNYTVALKVSTFHFNALTAQSSNVAIAALLVLYTPYHNGLVSASTAKLSALGDRIGDTQTKSELFLELTQVRLPIWQQMIGNVYARGTAAFKTLFPFGLDVFHNGTIENKLINLRTLRDKCTADASLAAVASLITSFYSAINNARNTQEGEKTIVGVGINNQQDAIEAMCIQMFADYGTIVSLFPNGPTRIKSFIDVVTLQDHVHSPLYTGVVNTNKIRKVATKTVTSLSKIKVSCDVDLMIWVNDSAKNPIHPAGVFIPANTPTIAEFPGLGNPDNRVFQIHNLSLTTKGHYTVEFL